MECFENWVFKIEKISSYIKIDRNFCAGWWKGSKVRGWKFSKEQSKDLDHTFVGLPKNYYYILCLILLLFNVLFVSAIILYRKLVIFQEASFIKQFYFPIFGSNFKWVEKQFSNFFYLACYEIELF